MVSFQIIFKIFIVTGLLCIIHLNRTSILFRSLSHTKQLFVNDSSYPDARFFQVSLKHTSTWTKCINLHLVADPIFICWLLGLSIFLISDFEIGWPHFINLLFSVISSLLYLCTCNWMLNQMFPSLRNVTCDCISHGQMRLICITFQLDHLTERILLHVWWFFHISCLCLFHCLSI